MPKGPKGEKRPGDVIGAAVKVAKIATGEIEEDTEEEDGKDKAAQALGRKGGKKGGKARWANQDLNRLRKPNVLPLSAGWRCYPGNLG